MTRVIVVTHISRSICLHISFTHVLSKKQQQDDLKAVERSKKELVQLDQQLKVSMAQYSKVRELNHELTQRLMDEEVRTGDVEYSLKVQRSGGEEGDMM